MSPLRGLLSASKIIARLHGGQLILLCLLAAVAEIVLIGSFAIDFESHNAVTLTLGQLLLRWQGYDLKQLDILFNDGGTATLH